MSPWLPLLPFVLLLAATRFRAGALRAKSIEVLVKPIGDSSRDQTARCLALAAGVMILWLLARAIWPDVVLGHMPALEHGWIYAIGLLLEAVGVCLAVSGQGQMGPSWRVGVPDSPTAGMVTEGLYASTRNPIYLGVLQMVLGAVLSAPTPVILACASVIAACLTILVRQEEEYMKSHWPEAFSAYAAKVPRWL